MVGIIGEGAGEYERFVRPPLCIGGVDHSIAWALDGVSTHDTRASSASLHLASDGYASASKIGAVKNGEQVVGNKTRVKVVKNKVAPPFRECEFEITYGTGISAVGEIVDLASEAGLIEKSGAYYSLNGESIAQGRDKACQYMAEHPFLADELRENLVALRKAENARLGAPASVPVGESEAA